MTSRLGDNPGPSNEFYDPYCELCHMTKKSNVKPFEFCFECCQFLCVDCLVFHSNLRSTKRHVTVRGDDMPKSIADKPPPYELCGEHPENKKDHFCSDHKLLICQLCSTIKHNTCSTTSVDQACQNISMTEMNVLYDSVNSFKNSLQSIIPSLDANKDKLEEQKRDMLKEAELLYKKLADKRSKMYQDIKSEITYQHQLQDLRLSQYQNDIRAKILRLESSLSELSELKGKTVDTKVFLKLQEIIAGVRKCETNSQNINQSLRAVWMSFVPRERIQEYLSSVEPLGAISTTKAKPDVKITIPDIWSPSFSTQNASDERQAKQIARWRARKQALSFFKIKYRKQGSYNIRTKDDEECCWITGMAITKDQRRLLVDSRNSKVKMFSRDMEFLSSVMLKKSPCDIAVVSDQEAIVSMEYSLVKLDISSTDINIRRTEHLPFQVQGIIKYQDKLIITTAPASVKMIDYSGMVYWSLSSDQKGQSLFGNFCSISSHYDERSSTVLVADISNNTLTLLDGDTGTVTTRRQKGCQYGVTCDIDGNVYVGCGFKGVAVLTQGLCFEKILLSMEDGLTGSPQAIMYDDTNRQLILSFGLYSDTVDCFVKAVHA